MGRPSATRALIWLDEMPTGGASRNVTRPAPQRAAAAATASRSSPDGGATARVHRARMPSGSCHVSSCRSESEPMINTRSRPGKRSATAASVSRVYTRPRSISSPDSTKRMSSATASAVISRRTLAAVRCTRSLCGGATAGTKSTRSRPSRACASEAMTRWPTCGGSKLPPMTPRPGRAFCTALGAHLPVAPQLVLDAGELLEGDGAAHMQLLRGDPHLRAQPELATVGEARRRVHVHAGGVDLGREPSGGAEVFGDDRLGVARAVRGDVLQGFVQGVDDAYGEVERQELRLVVRLVGTLQGRIAQHVGGGLVDHQLDAAPLQLFDIGRASCRERV